MTSRTYNVLILCTGNSARSIMAEALFATLGKGRFRAWSAGSHPGGTVNPFAIEQVARLDCPVEQLRSKSWDEFARTDAPSMDFVVTVCDNAAGETCPLWPGAPVTAHWGFEDPAAVTGSDVDKRAAFEKIFGQIKKRVENFLALPLDDMDNNAIRAAMKKIGEQAP